MAEVWSPPALPLSKSLDPADFPMLEAELQVVRRSSLEGQHPMRAWEYALALKAWRTWQQGGYGGTVGPGGAAWRVLDIGGTGSPFHEMFGPDVACTVVDPRQPAPFNQTLEESVSVAGYDPHQNDALFAISVLEHLEHPHTFLGACSRALAPLGLLFLTFDFTDTEGADTFHFHWMRERIYNPYTRDRLYKHCREIGYRPLGAVDWKPHGNHVYDYTFASLALVKGA